MKRERKRKGREEKGRKSRGGKDERKHPLLRNKFLVTAKCQKRIWKESWNDWTADLEMAGGAQTVDVVRGVVLKFDVVDDPVNLRRRNSPGTARDVAHGTGPSVRHATVIGSEARRNCNRNHHHQQHRHHHRRQYLYHH